MKNVDRYSLGKRIGESGAAAVYDATESLPGGIERTVRLKVFSADPAAQGRLTREIQALTALDGHPSFASFYGAGLADGAPWIALEQVEQTVQNLLGELPGASADVERLLLDVGRGLETLHSHEPPLLHHDIKPSSILVAKGGGYKIADLGVAGLATEEATYRRDMAPYAAPEVHSSEFGRIGPTTDLYALGQMAYRLSLGDKLYRAQFAGVFDPRATKGEGEWHNWQAWHCSAGITAPPIAELRKDFPAHLSQVIAKLMGKLPAGRYVSATQMLADLRQGGDVAVVATPPPVPVRAGAAPAKPPPFPLAAKPPAPAVGPRAAPVPQRPPPPPPRPTAAPAGAGTQYWVRLRDRKSGPFDLGALRRQVRQGLVSRLHQISTDQVNWRPAGTIEGLFGA